MRKAQGIMETGVGLFSQVWTMMVQGKPSPSGGGDEEIVLEKECGSQLLWEQWV